jgi:hypothetical protein
MKAKFVRYSICICGFPILSDTIPLGTVYEVDPNDTPLGGIICGGCGKDNPATFIWVFSRAGERPGYLPKDIFELEKPQPETRKDS